jgi:hypothetical protein
VETVAQEYLLKEYELCFEQLQFYDERQESILKYLFGLTSAVATAHFAVYKLLRDTPVVFFTFQALVSGLVFIATLVLYLATLENRLYFVVAARQVNAIRKYFMASETDKPFGFHENRMWRNPDMPALHPSSVHAFVILGAALVSSLFAGASAYAIRPAHPSWTTGTVTFIVVLASELVLGIRYLIVQGRETLAKEKAGRL